MKALFWGILTATLLFTPSALASEDKQDQWQQLSFTILGTILSGSLIGGFAWFLTTRSKIDTIPTAIAEATQVTEDKFEKQVKELQDLIAEKADRMYEQLSCYIDQQRELGADLHIVQDRLSQLPTAVEFERRLQVQEGKIAILSEKAEYYDKQIGKLNDTLNSVTSRLIAEGFKFRGMDK